MNLNSFCSLFLLIFIAEISEAGQFSIVGPRTVTFGDDYTFFLSAVDYDDDDEIEISLTGKTLDEEVFSEKYKLGYQQENITISLCERKTLQNYTLTAKMPSENFKQSVDIFTNPKRYSVFIQTDKPMYKPNDLIKFRVLVIDRQMRPYKIEGIKIELVDPYDNVVGKIQDEIEPEKLELGVVSGEFQIANEPVHGIWGLRVTTSEEDSDEDNSDSTVITDQKFKITEFVLPRFEVIVDTKHDVTQNERVVHLTIFGNYTFGGYVKGKATIVARLYDSNFPSIIQHTTTKTADVEFKKLVVFNIKEDLKVVNDIRPYLVTFDVEFEEAMTGQKVKREKPAEVRIHQTGEYYIELIAPKKRLKPGYPFKFNAIVRAFDGSLVSDRYNPVKLTVNYFFKPPKCTEVYSNGQNSKVFNTKKNLNNGITEFVLDVPANTTSMQIIASFQDDAKQTLNVLKHESRSREYLTISLGTENPKINKKVRINIEGNGNDWKDMFAVVIGKTGIVNTTVIHVTPEQRNKTKLYYDFVANEWMAPSAHVIIYYMQFFGEIVYDRLKIDFGSPFPNSLDLKLSSNKVKPRAKISISCKTTEGSFVSLLGVDQSVTLLGHGNDIDRSRIATDFSSYNLYHKYPELHIKGSEEQRYKDFEESNAFILTNALDGSINCEVVSYRGSIPLEKMSLDDSDDSGLDFDDTESESAEEGLLRRNFPETWIFNDFEADHDGKYKFEAVVPDTITSFVVTGFAVHPENGLAIAEQKKITVVQDFFLKLYLPYSVRLGEILKVDISVFNYIETPSRSVDATVELINNRGEFDFVDTRMEGSECKNTYTNDQKRSKQINVPSGTGASTFFLIKSLVTGEIKLKVKASSGSRKDQVEKKMLVENEGLTQTENFPKLFRLVENDKDSHFVDVYIDKESLLNNSMNIEVSAIGDLLGPALNQTNIQNLITMPSGCSEQQFKSWIPNIVAIRYLKSVYRLTNSFRQNGERFLATGYQQLLGRRKSDGSYSLWGEAGDSNIWLTAYVAKILNMAKDHTPIQDIHIVEALNYITRRQSSDGSFPASDRDYYYIKSNSQQGVPVTAFCAISISENKDYKSQYQSNIDRALNYISRKVASLEDNFAIAIAAYALVLNDHESAKGFIKHLKTNAFQNDREMYWFRQAQSVSNIDSASVKVEIAAYALMAFVKNGDMQDAVKVMNWLMTQRNSNGGFHSTTDTVVGIQALTKIAEALHVANTNIEVKVEYENRKKIFNINSNNAVDLQVEELQKDARKFEIKASGRGFAYVQVSYRYNTILDKPNERFEITAVPVRADGVLQLKVCTKFIPLGDVRQSQMTLVEVYLPSGYVYDKQTAEMVKSVNVRAIRQNIVAQLKDSVVKIYDYNIKNHRASAFYSLEGDKFCKL